MKNFKTLEVGKKYRARKGHKLTITKMCGYYFEGDDGLLYFASGRYYTEEEHPYDLIELIEENDMKIGYYKTPDSIVYFVAEVPWNVRENFYYKAILMPVNGRYFGDAYMLDMAEIRDWKYLGTELPKEQTTEEAVEDAIAGLKAKNTELLAEVKRVKEKYRVIAREIRAIGAMA